MFNIVFNRYSSSTGKFTADRPGLYFFTQYWIMDPNYIQWVQLWKNNMWLCQTYGDGADGNTGDWNSPSCSVTMELAIGDEVFVTTTHGNPVKPGQCAGFTGFLLLPYV